jgi:hypothetical protein
MAGKTWIWDMGKKARGTVRILQRESEEEKATWQRLLLAKLMAIAPSSWGSRS